MKIKVNNITPNISKLELTKIDDVYGSVLVVRGWV